MHLKEGSVEKTTYKTVTQTELQKVVYVFSEDWNLWEER